jgi:hypothetical protein
MNDEKIICFLLTTRTDLHIKFGKEEIVEHAVWKGFLRPKIFLGEEISFQFKKQDVGYL